MMNSTIKKLQTYTSVWTIRTYIQSILVNATGWTGGSYRLDRSWPVSRAIP